jgi:hypothetical protein
MAKPRPKTGEKRAVQQPLKIDKLPQEVRDAIQTLKNDHTWEEIEELSGMRFNPKWQSQGGGFVDWEKLPAKVAALFPNRRLPHSNLQRWYDIRVRQVMAETLARSAQARQLAASFAESIVKDGDAAVLNAARDQIMSILAESTQPGLRFAATKQLIALAEQMQGRRANDIKQRKVAVDERRLTALERELEMKRAKFEKETNAAAEKARRGQKLTEADINSIRSSVFGLGPATKSKK